MKEQWLFGTNWKMNKTAQEAAHYSSCLRVSLERMRGSEMAQVFVLPPYTAITAVKEVSDGKFWVGAQNMHWAEWGPHTGEISAPMLTELGIDLVQLGHAERRESFNDTDAAINRKVLTALRFGLRPLICVGEGQEEKKFRAERETVGRQVRIAMADVARELVSKIIIAYEPVWAIGEGADAADSACVRGMNQHLRNILADMFGSAAADEVAIVYGGSVTNAAAPEMLINGECDGLFVGRAALDYSNFAELIRMCLQAAHDPHARLQGV
jgi:triosephosphate isomerase